MTPPNIETSTREERLAYVREKWECMHNYKLPASVTYAWEITTQTAETADQDVTLTEGGSEVDDETYTYDGTEKKPTVVVKDKDGNIIPDTEYEVTYDDNTEAGTGKVIIKDVPGGNYVVEDNEIEFKINPKEVGLTWSTPASFEYDANSHTVTATETETCGKYTTLTTTDGEKTMNSQSNFDFERRRTALFF